MQLDRDQLGGDLEGFAGQLVMPGDAAYDGVRRVHNGMVDKRPALIARCVGAADAVQALAFARTRGMPVSVRGGGHNVAGRAVIDDGVVIDLSSMKGIHVDPSSRTARAQSGLTWAEFNRETAVHGLATTGGTISTTGIAGLTLGGGFGWLMPKYGLTVDNVRSVEVLTAAGDVVRADGVDNDDLFWALRGGGGSFGVALSFEYALHPLREVTGGLIAHPFDVARDLLRAYRDLTADLPDELMTWAALVHAPDGSGTKLAAFAVCHAGDPAQADVDLEPFRSWGAPAMTMVDRMPYPAINRMLDAGFPKGARSYWKSSFLRTLSDDAIDAIADGFAAAPSSMSGIVIEHLHGAPTRVPLDATPAPFRDVGYDLLVVAEWLDASEDEANIAWARATFDAASSAFTDRRYLNYLDDDDTAQDAFGPNAARLEKIKAIWDPDDVFRSTHRVGSG
jgi:FAD/FMN-containing dehydrogenase